MNQCTSIPKGIAVVKPRALEAFYSSSTCRLQRTLSVLLSASSEQGGPAAVLCARKSRFPTFKSTPCSPYNPYTVNCGLEGHENYKTWVLSFDLAKKPVSSILQVHPNLEKIQTPQTEYRKHPTLRSSATTSKSSTHADPAQSKPSSFQKILEINVYYILRYIQHPTHLYKRDDPCKAMSYIT